MCLRTGFVLFADAWRFYKTGSGSSVRLKLPDRLVELSHRILKRGVRASHLLVGGFVAG